MRLLEGYSTLYTSLSIRVSMIGAKIVCLSVTSKQAKIAPEWCSGVEIEVSPYTYYTEGSAGKCHITSVTWSHDRKSQCHIT